MGLTTCSDCGQDVSEAAEACPNCGRPMQATSGGKTAQKESGSGKRRELIGTLLVVGSIGACTAGTMYQSPNAPDTWYYLGIVGGFIGFIIFIAGRLS